MNILQKKLISNDKGALGFDQVKSLNLWNNTQKKRE